MPKGRRDFSPQKLKAQVVALANKRIEETQTEVMLGYRKRDFNRWVHQEISLFCFEEVFAKATGCAEGACLSCIHEVIFSPSVLHVLTSSSANPFWFWRIVKATAERAKKLPIELEIVEQAAQSVVAEEGAKLVKLTGNAYCFADGAFNIEALRRSYRSRRLLGQVQAREAALSLGILIVVPTDDPESPKTKFNPLFA